MGWLISIVIIVVVIFTRGSETIDLNALVIASSIFAVAGSLGSVSVRIRELKNEEQKNEEQK